MTEAQDRVWTLSDMALVEMFERIESEELTAAEAIAVLEELATRDQPQEEDQWPTSHR